MCAFFTPNANAQVLNKPEPAVNPNLSSTDPWTSACASSSFNEYFVNFTWSPNPSLVANDNEFILELSDPNGNFDTVTELGRTSDNNTVFDFDFGFALPQEVQGDGYRFRVRSTNPAMESPVSDAFSMYYIGYNNPILISQDASGVIPSGGVLEVCDGSGLTLATHNVPNADTYRYKWSRSSTPLSETSNSLTVTEPGMYYVEIDYGINCTGSANTLSNTIEVVITSPQGIAINPPAQTTLCSNESITLNANITGMGYLYTWFNGSSIVSGPTVDDADLVVDGSVSGFEGDYSVRIEGAGICAEQSAAITIESAANYSVTRNNPANLVLLPGQNQTLSVSTTAISATYQWFRDGAQISGETSASLTASQAGTYYVEVTETGGSCTLPPKNSESTVIVLPTDFELSIDYVGTYSDCAASSVTLTVLQINAIDGNGDRSDVTASLKDSFSYQWIKDGNALAGLTSDELVLNDVSDNGFYTLEGQITSYNITSNPLSVRLASSDTVLIESSGTQLCDGVVVTLTTTTDLTGADFTWTRNGTAVSTTDTSFVANETGTYQLSVSSDGCPIVSNEIVITNFDESVVQIDTDDTIVFPEGESQTVTATGASAYEWYDESNNLISSTDSVSLTDEGSYLLLASVGSCQITKTFNISYRDNFEIPNVITANGDGINDLWVLPNTYSRNSEVSVIIYNEKGEEVVNEIGYQNNWPASSTAFSKKNQIFYYKIRNGRETLRQGTITVIR